MFGVDESMCEIINYILKQPGDVVHQPKWYGREWFIVIAPTGSFPLGKCIASRRKKRIGQEVNIGQGTIENDPAKWPDEICPAVAAYRLTQ
jgi:hypothetical protein